MQITVRPAARAAATRASPGSEMPGKPASLITATASPASRASSNWGMRPSWLCWWKLTSLLLMPKPASNRPLRRVSSQAMRLAPSNTLRARGDRSPVLPIGVPTR